MKTSKHGITLIEGREGIRLRVYRDSKGLPTVGVGHLIVPEDNLKVGDKITQQQCDDFLAKDLGKAEAAVNSAVKVPLTQDQFDALVSFTVNIGTGGFKGSTVVKRLNAKDYNGAAKAMMSWVKPPEITGRRQTEQKQFLTSAAVSPGNPADTSENEPSKPALEPSVPLPLSQQAETIVNTGDQSAPTPPPTDVTVAAAKPSWKTTIGAALTALWGYYQLAKANFSDLVDRATGAIDAHLLANIFVGAAFVSIAYWLYNHSQQRAHEKTLELIKAASDPALNNINLK